ncbi:TPA: helix-turn-helix domain-containing protein [Staphylococcus aureus]|uniref:Toxin-antitoxin system, antitoxin component, Xre domain protein n=1 Tax=Staphylococcus chromogenes TaxID=46126 RepID=A0AAE5T129_STACR|nr:MULTISPECIES: helix-turn-helix transcriptional regulator [Staphylococcus]MCM0467030.1 helix-turn-helix domain-containing protein [Staphylococcus aureus]MCQ9300849.1 helix-turn-helix domain-containing protein [Staphylococcus hyicus]MDG6601552.1 helix-turn-helix transcriptional regulator [Staphylococcus aureus]NJH78467.1 helix-turn-helix domain-containing protein [Staphylococcus agnetis]NJH99162.1 helix-turn-helix domain-containing protein [Staphylococcus hyicus]
MFSIDEKLSSKLREIRARKNITLQQASKEIGISSKTLSLIENEVLIKVKRTTYEKITKWLINEVK